MRKGFQKSANKLEELQLSHPGIIHADDFARHFELHCYKPSPELQPFVLHIWTQRPKKPIDPLYKPPVELLSGPNVYLFFTPDAAFIHSVSKGAFQYDPLSPGVIAGVKFRPGGFYPFLRRSVSELAGTTPTSSVFAAADRQFSSQLVTQPDEMIVRMIEELLQASNPQNNKNLDMVARIMDAITHDSSLRTVGATAQAFTMSERSLQLLFHTYVGVGVKWVITRQRLLEAIRRAASQPHRTWVDIAAELGYSSQSHFSRDFKEAIGLAPSEYARLSAAQRLLG